MSNLYRNNLIKISHTKIVLHEKVKKSYTAIASGFQPSLAKLAENDNGNYIYWINLKSPLTPYIQDLYLKTFLNSFGTELFACPS